MASSIDATKPTAGTALTSDVRANFAAAKAEIEALQAGSGLAAGSVSDAAIGNRTPDQSVAAVTGPGTITQIFNWFANRIKAISGETNWYDAVGTSLKSHVANTSNPHGTTMAQVGLTDAAPKKVTPVDADYVNILDSAAAFVFSLTTWANIKATLKAYFDTIYAQLAGLSSQVFSVGVATAAAHAMRLDQSYVAQDFRLTLTMAVPVTTADVTGATTIYCTPYKGNRIGLYNGTVWVNYNSAEFSLALGTLTATLPYDVFCYQNAGVPTLEFLAWTNGTTRATALAYSNGILTKSGDTTRRYLGTFYTTSTTATEDSTAKRYLWNYYNRVLRKMRRVETTASWTYTTATWRQANNSVSNQLNFIIGLSEDDIEASITANATNATASVPVRSGLALDSTTVPSRYIAATAPGSTYMGMNIEDIYTPGVGVHYIAWLEHSNATGTTTWQGSTEGSYGIIGSLLA